MTLGEQKMSRAQFYNIALKIGLSARETLERLEHIRTILKQQGKNPHLYTGKNIFSLFLPLTLLYEKKNNANPDEPVVKIHRGVLYEGTLDKTILGATHNSLIQVIHKEYGKDAAAHFIDCVQFATNNWLFISGFSIGLGDCMTECATRAEGANKEQEIKDVIMKSFMEAEAIKTTTSHPGIREMRVNATLNKAKDVGLRIAKDALSKDNNFLTTVRSGSKGDFVNIAQIVGLLGQQNLKGKRIKLMMNHGRRSLPHYPFGEHMTPEMEYESRGFISSSFLHGLKPEEFYFHAMSGREGVCDKVVSQTGGCLIIGDKQCYLLVLLIFQ